VERPTYPIKCKSGRESGKPFTDTDRAIFAAIISHLRLPGAWAWGSRTRGWWIDSSDYDIIVTVTTPEESRTLRTLAAEAAEKFGVKVDLFINHPPYADAVWVDAIEPSPTTVQPN
jgi:predicted nucleotidyltransferase